MNNEVEDLIICHVIYVGTDAYLHLTRLANVQEPLP